MNSTDQIKAIQDRQHKIEQQIVDLEEELEELEVALRVLTRFSPKGSARSKAATTRPSGTPSTYEMVDLVLSSAEKEGKPTLTMREIVDAIRGRFWPGVTTAQLSPLIYRFTKQGRLRRTETGFARTKK